MSNLSEIAGFARKWRTPMLRFAKLHLNNHEDAEDVVQDALAAAMTSSAEEMLKPDPRPYVFGILKNKIVDRLRKRYRSEPTLGDASGDELDSLLFNARGHWLKTVAPQRWSTPDEHLMTDGFFKVVDACVERLPAKAARVFSMKELLECEVDEICLTMAISKSDYWQCMSRARKQLQLCLNQKWFEGEQQS